MRPCHESGILNRALDFSWEVEPRHIILSSRDRRENCHRGSEKRCGAHLEDLSAQQYILG